MVMMERKENNMTGGGSGDDVGGSVDLVNENECYTPPRTGPRNSLLPTPPPSASSTTFAHPRKRSSETPTDLINEDMPDIAMMLKHFKSAASSTEYHQNNNNIQSSGNVINCNNSFFGEAEPEIYADDVAASAHSPSASNQEINERNSDGSGNGKRFTWIMESGHGPISGGRNSNAALRNLADSRQAYFQRLQKNFGLLPFLTAATNTATPNHSPFVPPHFQHLLAASSLLYQDPIMGTGGGSPLTGGMDPATAAMLLSYSAAVAAAGMNGSGKKCNNCGATSTPSWRRCPAGKDLLCNACGLYQKLHNKARPFKIAEDGSIRVQRNTTGGGLMTMTVGNGGVGDFGVTDGIIQEMGAKVCAHCGVTETPLWRKVGHEICCNACALYFKTHGIHRTSSTEGGQPPEDSNINMTNIN